LFSNAEELNLGRPSKNIEGALRLPLVQYYHLSARNEINGWSTSNFDGDDSGELVDERQHN